MIDWAPLLIGCVLCFLILWPAHGSSFIGAGPPADLGSCRSQTDRADSLGKANPIVKASKGAHEPNGIPRSLRAGSSTLVAIGATATGHLWHDPRRALLAAKSLPDLSRLEGAAERLGRQRKKMSISCARRLKRGSSRRHGSLPILKDHDRRFLANHD